MTPLLLLQNEDWTSHPKGGAGFNDPAPDLRETCFWIILSILQAGAADLELARHLGLRLAGFLSQPLCPRHETLFADDLFHCLDYA